MFSRVVLVLGDSSDRLVSVCDLEAAIPYLSKEMGGLVKATVDARLDRLGTVGAPLVNEFMATLTSLLGEIVATCLPLGPVGGSGGQGAVLSSTVAMQSPPSPSTSVALSREAFEKDASSVVPSAFGVQCSTASVAGGGGISAEPGKNSKDQMREF